MHIYIDLHTLGKSDLKIQIFQTVTTFIVHTGTLVYTHKVSLFLLVSQALASF